MGEFLIAGMFWQQILAEGTRLTPDVSPSRQVETREEWIEKQNRQFYLDRAEATRQRIEQREQMAQQLQTNVVSDFSKNSRTTVIISPHPDDEILCCSRTIADKLVAGEKVKIVYLTDGDALADEDSTTAREYGATRRQESRLATRELGLTNHDLFFLGFPDGHLADLDQKGSARSEYTARRVSGANSVFPHSPYTRVRLKENLRKLLTDWTPDEIYIPSRMDDHPDHLVAGKIVQEILGEENFTPEILAYTVHRQECLDERCPADQALDFKKLNLIRVFKSQRHDRAHEIFLDQFASQIEVFQNLTSEVSTSR
jgi:LmbE family N-acetylglucosaminyl deacetylase